MISIGNKKNRTALELTAPLPPQDLNTVRKLIPTWFPVLFSLPVKSADTLHQLPLLTAPWIVDKIPGQYLFQLPDRQALNIP